MNKKTLVIGIVIGVVILLCGIGSAWLYLTAQPTTLTKPLVQLSSYTVHRTGEVPFSTHRALSTTTAQNATSLMPWGIALDAMHGYVWVAEPGCNLIPQCPASAGDISQYAYSDGSFIQDIHEPTGYPSPLFIAADKNGFLWFTATNSDAIGEYIPQSGNWNQWPLKKGAIPYDLAFDTQGNLWFTEYGTNTIGFLNTQTHTLVETSTPTTNSTPYGMVMAPDGTMWFTENEIGLGQIGSFTPTASGKVTIAEHKVVAQRPHLLTIDRQGNIWYSDGFSGFMGVFNPRTGTSNEFLVYSGTCTLTSCTGTHISGIAVDSQGHIWFTDSLSQRVGYLIPSSGQVIARTLKTNNAHPYDGLVIDSSNRVWFTDQFGLMLNLWPAGTLK